MHNRLSRGWDRTSRSHPVTPVRRLALTGALFALVAAAVVPLAAGPASATTPVNATTAVNTSVPASASPAAGTITSGTRCLDDADFGTANGTVIQLFDCNGSAAQKWTWENDGTVRVFGKCLDVTGGSNATGALLQLYTCTAGAVQQRFAALPDGTIYSPKSAKCLAVQGTPANLTRVGLASCDPSKPAQQWKAQTAPAPRYTLTGAPAQKNAYASDTPNSPYIDRDGTFYQQYAHALYGKTDPREWKFLSGSNVDTVTPSPLNDAVNPANPLDKNNDTTWRCDNSPTGKKSTVAAGSATYSQRNYCDLAGVWVDPDSGDWYGLVHNEFTPQPFGDGMHYDSVDYAVSRDQGKTWTIKDQVLTSPYSTQRGDTAAFPGDNYYYGDGDQRLFVDNASGYFYVFYASRTIAKPGVAPGQSWLQHVARAPISQKMAPSSWQKWYNGAWQQPGIGGKESNIVPADGNGPGFTAPADDYSPTRPGSQPAQVAAGTLPDDSQLAVMNIAWSAYLGKYFGTPQNSLAQDTGTKTPQHVYATDDLATQKWTDLGTVDSNKNASWYRWLLDSGSRTSGTILGKTFRTYCSFECTTFTSEYSETTIEPKNASDLPQAPVSAGTRYRLTAAGGGDLTVGGTSAWTFTATGDGFFTLGTVGTGSVLGVDASGNAGRAWGAVPTLAAAATSGDARIGQQWSFQRVTTVPSPAGASVPTAEYRLVNRYSGLALSVTGGGDLRTATSPIRQWNAPAGSTGDSRPEAAQRLTLTPLP
ncbi:hypothetical protein D9V34_02950 [Mycetocola lacteus]|uniref:Ricin B lectin domain-containing protein n=1 Tax=Mycetocola lacteus TaxID=76637 RepID=A0A3L7ATD4_9MICO|nr:ricin-type beta-trefoil lectin domain protein [Mycetocola lacteus]RLP83783.1 hypothetical protein D9V34_02950 [Mycetocola lacteus]